MRFDRLIIDRLTQKLQGAGTIPSLRVGYLFQIVRYHFIPPYSYV